MLTCLHFDPLQASHSQSRIHEKKGKKERERKATFLLTQIISILVGSMCSPRYQWAGSFVETKGFPESRREPEGRDSAQEFSLREKQEVLWGECLPLV